MKVYLVETGCYEQRAIEGVYATLEAALAANPVSREGKQGDPRKGSAERPGGWLKNDYGYWSNGLDWDEAAVIEEYEVQE